MKTFVGVDDGTGLDTALRCRRDRLGTTVAVTRDHRPGKRLVRRGVSRGGLIDLVVNNAGATKRGDFLGLTEQGWSERFALKFFGAVRLCRAAWPHLVASRGSVVNIAGVGGRTGSAEFAVGGSVKAALLNLTKCLADRGVRDGVRVNAINPGSIKTDRLAAHIRRLAEEQGIPEEEAARQMTQRLGIGRFGEPSEVAVAVAFLASAQAACLQGTVLDVDGGLTRRLWEVRWEDLLAPSRARCAPGGNGGPSSGNA